MNNIKQIILKGVKQKVQKISNKQLKTIWWLGHSLGLDEDEVHDMVLRITGDKSISRLNSFQGTEVIKTFIEMGAPVPVPKTSRRSTDKKKRRLKFKNSLVLATDKQKKMIYKLSTKVFWIKKDGFKRWLLTSYGISEIRTNWDVTMVKQGLLSLIRQQKHIKN
jgi:hypothetical protein